MQNTRRQILKYLGTNAPASASAIQQALLTTVANIRHHLRRLEEDGFVEVVGQKQVLGRGRPTLLYGLTPQAAAGDLTRLVLALWQLYIEGAPSDAAARNITAVAKLISPSGGQPDGSLTQRLYQAVRQLRTLDYEARWEAHADSPLIILKQCPFAAVRSDLPAICTLDGQIITRLVGQPVEQISERDLSTGGAPHCVFRVLTS